MALGAGTTVTTTFRCRGRPAWDDIEKYGFYVSLDPQKCFPLFYTSLLKSLPTKTSSVEGLKVRLTLIRCTHD